MDVEAPVVAPWQCGVFTREQARQRGWSDRQVRRRVETGRWVRVAGVALALNGTPIGPRALAVAVRLSWPDGVVSHELAGALWELPVHEPHIATATVSPGQVRRGYRLRARRSEIPLEDRQSLGRVHVTTRERTQFDLLGCLPWAEARSLLAWLLSRRLLDLAELDAAITRRKHLQGNVQRRRLLAVSASGSFSAAEDAFHQLMHTAQIDGWIANAPIEVGGRVVALADVLFPAARVIVEIDGWAAHGTREAFQRDRSRQNQLVAAGYLVLRFTWADLTERPAYVVATLRRVLTKIS